MHLYESRACHDQVNSEFGYYEYVLTVLADQSPPLEDRSS